MNSKLIAIDMDGTLLNSKNKISERNISAIKKATDLGVKIVLCTGRIFTSALYYSNALELSTPIIACNGAYIAEKDKSKIIYANPISLECTKEVLNLAEQEGMYYHFYDDSKFYARELTKTVENYYRWNIDKDDKDRLNITIIDNPLETVEREKTNVYKFVFVEDDGEKLQKFRNKLSDIKGIEVSSSWWNNMEIMNKGVSKGNALNVLCDLLDIDSENVMAIGDNENDIPMLKFAGTGVAMGNGEEIVKENADFVTDTNEEDGVAKAIEKFII